MQIAFVNYCSIAFGFLKHFFLPSAGARTRAPNMDGGDDVRREIAQLVESQREPMKKTTKSLLKSDVPTESQIMSTLIRQALASRRVDLSRVPHVASVAGISNGISATLNKIFEDSSSLNDVRCGIKSVGLPIRTSSYPPIPDETLSTTAAKGPRLNGFSYYALLPAFKRGKDTGSRILHIQDKYILDRVTPTPKLVAAANNLVNAVLQLPEARYVEEQSFKKYARLGTTTGSAAAAAADMSTLSEYEEEVYSMALAMTEWRNPLSLLRFLSNQQSRMGFTATHLDAFEIALATAGLDILQVGSGEYGGDNEEMQNDVFYRNIVRDILNLSKTCKIHARNWGANASLIQELCRTSTDLTMSIVEVAKQFRFAMSKALSNGLNVSKLVETDRVNGSRVFTPRAVCSFKWPEFAVENLRTAMVTFMNTWMANISAIRKIQIRLASLYGFQDTELVKYLKQNNHEIFVTDICTRLVSGNMTWPETQRERAAMGYPADCDKIFPTLFAPIYYGCLSESFMLEAVSTTPGELNFYNLTREEQKELRPALVRGAEEPFNLPLQKWLRLFNIAEEVPPPAM